MQGSEDKLQESLLPFHHVGSGDDWQFYESPDLLSHLGCPWNFFFFAPLSPSVLMFWPTRSMRKDLLHGAHGCVSTHSYFMLFQSITSKAFFVALPSRTVWSCLGLLKNRVPNH